MFSRNHLDNFTLGKIFQKSEITRKNSKSPTMFFSKFEDNLKISSICTRCKLEDRSGYTAATDDRYIVALQHYTCSSSKSNACCHKYWDIRENYFQTLASSRITHPRTCWVYPTDKKHRGPGFQRFRQHPNWSEDDWMSQIFSEESRLNLSYDCRRKLIYWESGSTRMID